MTQDRNSRQQTSAEITFKLLYINVFVWEWVTDANDTGKKLYWSIVLNYDFIDICNKEIVQIKAVNVLFNQYYYIMRHIKLYVRLTIRKSTHLSCDNTVPWIFLGLLWFQFWLFIYIFIVTAIIKKKTRKKG